MQRLPELIHLTTNATQYSVAMHLLPDFPITRPGRLSDHFREQQMTTFYEVVKYLESLPYDRLNDPRNYASVLTRGRGTFTARHAILVQLANEQQIAHLTLALCVYDLAGRQWTEVGSVLRRHGLDSLPEVCGCIRHEQGFYSLEETTMAKQGIVSAVEIAPLQIGNFKRRYHSNYLANWIALENMGSTWSVAALWAVRNECLEALARQWNSQRSSVSQ